LGVQLEARVLFGLTLASIAVYCATPVAIRVAARLEFYDKPVGYKGHARPTPYLGGAAVMAGFLLALAALAEDARRSAPVAAGAAILWAVGTIDDRRHVAPLGRAGIEVAIATCLWALGLGWELGWGAGLDLALTCLWIVGVVNAFNLFDNMDGAASSMALVVSAAVSVLGVIERDAWLAATGAALAGACLGFLPHNLTSPARIFLGDGGSMPVGFVVAAIVMIGVSDAVPEWQALVVGLMLVGIPAVDTCLVVVSRRRKGLSILTGGRDHLTHRTRRRLRDARRVALVLGSVQALVAALALFAVRGGSLAIVAIVLVFVVVASAAIALLEVEEDRMDVAVAERVTSPDISRAAPGAAPARSLPAYAALAALGLGAGLSAFWFGFYDATKWVPLGLGIFVAAAAGTIARPPRLSASGAVALTSVVALAVWTLLSSLWAESVDQSVTEGNRLLALAAVLGLALVLLRDESRAAWLVGLIGAGILAVALWTVGSMLGSEPASVLLNGRLNEPLAYINAEATLFIMGFWLALALAERRQVWMAGPGLAVATLMASLVLLSQSRGAALAFAASAVAVLAIVPGRRRRVFALLLVVAGVAAVGQPLLNVYETTMTAGGPSNAVVRTAARAALLAASAVGLSWAALTALANRGIATNPRAVHRSGSAVLALVALAVVIVGAASTTRIADRIAQQYNAFVYLSEPSGSVVPGGATGSRLISGAGNRFDYWRVGWASWRREPVLGVGAGNYDAAYFRERTTTEDVRQPHSIVLQTLSETGIIGFLLLLAAFAAVVAGAVRAGGAARRSPLTHAVIVAGVGGASAWMVHTSVDWMHLLPGVTAVALCLIAVVLRQRDPGRAHASQRQIRPFSVVVAVAVAFVLVLGGASLTRQGLAEYYRQRALEALPTRPAEALRRAEESLRLNGDALPTYYVKAAAQARFNRGAEAMRTLLRAGAKEPSDFVTWTLLGDLAIRRGNRQLAGRYYAHASRLNPRDPALAALAADPSSARP
jgi:UDP-GlcNAc:undecaprenyl-phosphate GlcNAc-1-phosphate transferase